MEQEIITVHSSKVGCDGGGGPLGHPLVYLTFAKGETETVCPYCSRKFILAEGAHDDHGH